MSEELSYTYSCYSTLVISFVVFVVSLTGTKQPLGRYVTRTNISVPAKLGWFVMEFPNLLALPIAWYWGSQEHINSFSNMFLLSLYIFHYIHRVFIYPLYITSGNPMPLHVLLLGFLWSLYNSYLQGRYFSKLGPIYSSDHLRSPGFMIGFALYIFGMAINIHSDRILTSLR
eukprot:TRINITY_DN2796_c0_g1_i3.p1 TRINITY_DN2796_c0_g1~~TRINITY_DN2796_c0_g1_i3.p1  ORF type:complete len:172 (-),score=13.23 TRINITY_DN2796_c0_g1_i3:557-1072(-)